MLGLPMSKVNKRKRCSSVYYTKTKKWFSVGVVNTKNSGCVVGIQLILRDDVYHSEKGG